MNRSFIYDDLHRLKTATGFWGNNKTFTYDEYGNRTNDPIANTASWQYDSQFRLIRPSGSGSPTLAYDSLGNLTTDPSFAYAYTPDNLIETVTPVGGGSPIATYRYDGDGQRLARIQQGGTPHFSIRGPGGQVLSEFEEQPCGAAPLLRWTRDSIYAGGRIIASLKSAAVLPTVAWSSTSSAASESGPANVTAVLSTSTTIACPVTVAYTAAPGTATSADLGSPLSGVLTFPAGSPSGAMQTAVIPLINDLMDEDDTESFSVTLSSANGATIAGNPVHQVSIIDDDPPTVSINDASVVEGTGATATLSFIVTLSRPHPFTTTVSWQTATGTAVANDFTMASGQVSFAPGQVSKPLNISVTGDSLHEALESFSVQLSNPVNGTILDGTGAGSIIDNDPVPGVSIADLVLPVAEPVAPSTGSATMTLSLSAESGTVATVNYATQNGTALAGADYTGTSGMVTFNPGETTKTISIPILADTAIEHDENVFVNLSGATESTITDGSGTLTIGDSSVRASRVFLSMSGADGNNCLDIATPCRTFTEAIYQVATDGEVIVLGSGAFGPIAVNKPLKLTGTSGIVVFAPSPTVINVASGAVVLRSLTIKAIAPGTQTGVTVSGAGSVLLEGVQVSDWGVGLSISGSAKVFVKGSTFRSNGTGIRMESGASDPAPKKWTSRQSTQGCDRNRRCPSKQDEDSARSSSAGRWKWPLGQGRRFRTRRGISL